MKRRYGNAVVFLTPWPFAIIILFPRIDIVLVHGHQRPGARSHARVLPRKSWMRYHEIGRNNLETAFAARSLAGRDGHVASEMQLGGKDKTRRLGSSGPG